ncbi:chemotaxis protein CheW [Rugamonas sp. CCM 8940]|uniref:chemotaxis protein CheW n=1 Tax=Rugamonas sp. CCM 8940 TaxID=2765359 RepID=UPI0018F48C55|nr:chemotaxis protein CheW [Rugamonas sp. CCM 8940]MBJ7308841.1 chemotaxis protein CheW [Rugamonas sp. CCM 8940]
MPTSTITAAPAPAAIVIDDCWNRIGVGGDQSCPKLVQHVHCRNCEVYAGAAQLNLQRPLDANYKLEWAEHFRQPPRNDAALDASRLVFRLGREWLALPTALFVAVAPQTRPHRLPHRSGRELLGVVNVGGTLHPCMSLAAMLGIDENEPLADTQQGRHIFPRLLLLRWNEQTFAVPAADLHGIVRHASAALQAPAATINKGLARYLAGVLPHADMHIGCLDPALIGQQLARALR